MYPDIEWDERKAQANIRKHGVSFDEAATAFRDPFSIFIEDEGHSDDEIRYVHFGMSQVGRLLASAYTERGLSIRLISARKATAAERRHYEQQIG